MDITIKTIPHTDQRYETVGDWWFDPDGNLQIRVSDTGNWRYDAAVAVHELVEVLLCKNDGVPQEAVDAFDMAYEEKYPPDGPSPGFMATNAERASNLATHPVEPGDSPDAPYHRQHCYATAVERMLIAAMGLSWAEYDEAINAL